MGIRYCINGMDKQSCKYVHLEQEEVEPYTQIKCNSSNDVLAKKACHTAIRAYCYHPLRKNGKFFLDDYMPDDLVASSSCPLCSSKQTKKGDTVLRHLLKFFHNS